MHQNFEENLCDSNNLITYTNILPVQDSYLLPEFNDLLKEFDSTAIKPNPDSPIPNTNSPPKVNPMVKTDSQEQEIKNLENMVKMLKERERNLEVQLLEYYGLKEQQTAVTELQNRLKLNTMEAKVLALKIESLEADNKRLASQVVDYNKVLTDLEAAHAKIDVLKQKLRSEAAQNKERILDLQQRVEKMQEDELKLCKLKDLEDEVCELRKTNHDLQVEKSELTQRLERAQILATSVLEDQETEKLKKESEHLKKQNEELTKEIEQLQADRCSDVEELVYMRWVNACLRYELRNYQPGPSKTMARDLSKSLSPRSEEKAKKLILKYANQEPDSDQWSMGSSELNEPFTDHSSSRKTNNKFFGKLVKFIRGKDKNTPDHHHRHHSQCSHSRNSSFEDMNSYSDYYSSKYSMDSRISVHRHSDFGIHNRIDSIDEGDDINDGFLGSFSSSDGQRSELMKYAEVLKDSNLKPPTRCRGRSKSFSSF
ncbi:protein CHUP1, chloroplastic-like [Bidens hawaiensis]|uniref:protein CHUP1, chloroplastic-like n=1 Tax=Bidens hawaiensis TaxID=980011 RepID=UPI00404A5B6E